MTVMLNNTYYIEVKRRKKELLKKVVFCMQHFDDSFNSELLSAVDTLEEAGIRAFIKYPEAADIDNEKLLTFIMGDSQEEPCNMLIATDSDQMAKVLMDKGAFVIGVQHENNKGQEFPGLKYVFSDIEYVDADSYEKAYERYAGIPWKILETDRCLIRETTLEDVDSFYEIYADPEMTRYMEGLFEDPADEKKYTRDYIEKVYGLMGFGTWTVILKETGEIIGRAGFSIRNGFDDVELGFLIGTKHQRQGYAYEVCKAIVEYGRDVLMFERLQALVKAENTVSIHLCEKLGFVKYEEVNVEENIYGSKYGEGVKVPISEAEYGKYVKMLMEF